MKKYIFFLGLFLSAVSVNAQMDTLFTLIAEWGVSSQLTDSTFSVNANHPFDQLGQGFLPTAIQPGYYAVDAYGRRYEVQSITSTTFGTSTLVLKELQDQNLGPSGVGLVHRKPSDSDQIPVPPGGNTGLAPATLARIHIHNVMNGGGAGGSNNAIDILITDLANFFSSGNVEGALAEVADSLQDLRTDLQAVSAGASDGYAQSGAYDAVNKEIDVNMAAPANNFSIDASALTDDAELADTASAIRGDIPNITGLATQSALIDTAAAIRADFPLSSTDDQTLSFTSPNLSIEGGNSVDLSAIDTDTQLSTEEVQDIAGGMFSGNTETLITATYQDADGTIDLTVNNDLSQYNNTTSDFATSSDIPTNVSELTNDSGYITSQTDDQTAIEVSITDVGGHYTATEVENALQEVGDSITDLRTDLTAIAAGASDGYVQSGSYNSGLDRLELNMAAPASDVNIDMSTMPRLTSVQDDSTFNFRVVSGNTVSGTVIPDNITNGGITVTSNGVGFNPDGEDTFDPTASGLPGTVNTIQEGITANASNVAALDVLVGQRATQSALIDTAAAIRADFPLPSTDDQTLSFTSPNLSISNGNSVDLSAIDTDTQLSTEEVQDIAGGMFSGNTETLITATYQDADGTIDLAVNNDLSQYNNAISDFATNTALQDTAAAIRSDIPAPSANGIFDASNEAGTTAISDLTLGSALNVDMGSNGLEFSGTNTGAYENAKLSFSSGTGQWEMSASKISNSNLSGVYVNATSGVNIASFDSIRLRTPAVINSTATVGQVLQLADESGKVEFATVAGGGGDVTTAQLGDSTAVLRDDLTPQNKVAADYGTDMPTFGTISDRNILFASVDRFAVTNAGLTNESGTRVNLFDGISVPAMKITSDTAYIYIDLTPSFGSSGLENPGGNLYVSGGANLDDTSVACWIRLKNSSNNYSSWREATIVTAPNGSGYFEVSTSSLSPVNTFCTEIQIRFINALTANQFLHEIWWAVDELDGRPTERVSKGVRADFSRNGISVYSGGGSGERDTYLAGNNDNYIVANSGRDLCIGCDDPAYLLDVNGVLRLRPNDTGFSPAVEGTMYWDDSENTLIAYRGTTPWTRNVWRYQNTPSSSSDTGGYEGDIAYDANYLYIKTGSGWRRVALSTF